MLLSSSIYPLILEAVENHVIKAVLPELCSIDPVTGLALFLKNVLT